jgi:hypothetical protein
MISARTFILSDTGDNKTIQAPRRTTQHVEIMEINTYGTETAK